MGPLQQDRFCCYSKQVQTFNGLKQQRSIFVYYGWTVGFAVCSHGSHCRGQANGMSTLWRFLVATEKKKKGAPEGLISTLKHLALKGHISLSFTAHGPHSIQDVLGNAASCVPRTWTPEIFDELRFFVCLFVLLEISLAK